MPKALFMIKDRELETAIVGALKCNGFEVFQVQSLQDLYRTAAEQKIDVAVMEDAYFDRPFQEMVRRFRESLDTPLLVLSRESDEINCILALELGADDYMRGPVSCREAAVRCRNLLLRQQRSQKNRDQALQIGDIRIRPAAHTVEIQGCPVDVSNLEYQILEEMLKRPGTPLSRRDLFERVLGRDYHRDDRSLDMHISSLRKKLGPHKDGSERIRTLRGVGYLYYVPGDGS